MSSRLYFAPAKYIWVTIMLKTPPYTLKWMCGGRTQPPGTGYAPRLDGLERVLAVGVRGGFAEPQKVRVLRGGIGIGDVGIPTSRIGLPDLHHGALDRPALFVDDASGDLNDLAVRLSGRARDDGQVVVVDHRPCTVEAVQIKWSLVLPGRLLALLSECQAGDRERSPGDQHGPQNVAPGDLSVQHHADSSCHGRGHQ